MRLVGDAVIALPGPRAYAVIFEREGGLAAVLVNLRSDTAHALRVNSARVGIDMRVKGRCNAPA